VVVVGKKNWNLKGGKQLLASPRSFRSRDIGGQGSENLDDYGARGKVA